MADFMTPQQVEQNRKLASGFLQQGTDASPVGHWTQALARVLQGGTGGYMMNQANQAESQGKQAVADIYSQGLNSGADRKSIASRLMGTPSGAEQGQKMAAEYLSNQAQHDFQQEQQNRQFAQQREMARLQNTLSNNREPDIVRTMRAGGIDPKSPEGQEIIRNTIKGQGPLDKIIADALGGVSKPAGAAPAQPQSGLQQQSFDGGSDPNLILAQSGPSQPQPSQAPPDDPMVQTPMGQMPQSKARTLGFALALQGKGEAGKMMGDSPQPGALGKEGINHIDKTLVDKAMDLGELQSIKGAFRPEYLGLEGQAKGVGLGWADWMSGGKIDPQSRQFLNGYTSFATATTERLNNRIKTLSGSAVSGAEEKRMYAANPSVSDGPTVFKAKLDQQIDMQRLAVARFNWLKTKFKGNDAQIADLAKTGRIEGFSSLDGMKQVIDRTLGEAEQKIRQTNPNIDDQTLRNQMRIIQKRAFGI